MDEKCTQTLNGIVTDFEWNTNTLRMKNEQIIERTGSGKFFLAHSVYPYVWCNNFASGLLHENI